MQRARSESAKLEREDSILTATEILLRQSGYDSMTMQAAATAAGLAKGTLYLYFASRESLVIAVYGRLFDRWLDRLAVHKPESNGFDEFCRDFARHYSDDALFLQLSGFINSLAEPQLDREAFINGKRAMARRAENGNISSQRAAIPGRRFSVRVRSKRQIARRRTQNRPSGLGVHQTAWQQASTQFGNRIHRQAR